MRLGDGRCRCSNDDNGAEWKDEGVVESRIENE